jgi:enoyl-CoA hydratase/carnithine racemase
MILGGQNIQGEEALRIGLADHIVPQKNFFSHVNEVAEKYLATCSLGTRMSKRVTNRAFENDL